MHRYLSSLLCVVGVGLGAASYGQAMFSLSNGFGVEAPVYDAEGVPLTGPNYLAELYGGLTADSLAPATDGLFRRMAPFSTGADEGYIDSRYAYGVTIWEVPFYQPAALQLRAWDARLGATYEEVVALDVGGYGESPVFYAFGNNAEAEPPAVPAPLIGLQSFSLRPIVPEPATAGLLLLGGVLLWWARRHSRRWSERKTFAAETTDSQRRAASLPEDNRIFDS